MNMVSEKYARNSYRHQSIHATQHGSIYDPGDEILSFEMNFVCVCGVVRCIANSQHCRCSRNPCRLCRVSPALLLMKIRKSVILKRLWDTKHLQNLRRLPLPRGKQ